MKNCLITVVVLALSTTLYAATELESAQVAAQRGYREFLALCLSAEDAHIRHGLDVDDCVENATLGEAVPVERVTAQSIASYSSGMSVGDLLTWDNTFLVPVKFGGITKLMITVRKYAPNEDYKIGALGNRLLANELNQIKSQQSSGSSQLVLGYNRETREYLFHLPTMGGNNLTLIDFSTSPTRGIMGYATLSSADTVMEVLKRKLEVVIERGTLW